MTTRQRKINALYGYIVGDALGVPFEFSKINRLKKLEMIGHGTHDQPAGTWSDDTSFVLATLNSDKTITSIHENYLKVLDGGYSIDYLFDVGQGTADHIENGYNPCFQETQSKGNGSLMRVLPFALLARTGDEGIIKNSVIDAYIHKLNLDAGRLTHDNRESRDACGVLLRLYIQLLRGKILELSEKYEDISKTATNGYVEDSLKICINVGLTAKSYEEAMLTCINLGGDTDTHCAITGSIVALRLGRVPQKLINKLRGKDSIETIIEKSVWLEK